MAKINNLSPSKINGISLGTAITVGEWGARPGTGDTSLTPSSGDWFRVSSSAAGLLASYRYSSTIGEWVRPEAYGGSPTLLIRMRGSVLPSEEDPAWTHITANGGAITTDGTKVTFDGADAANETAYVTYDHDQTHVYHFMQGLVQCTATGAPDNSIWRAGRIIGISSHTNFTDYHKHKIYKVVLDTNAPTASFATNGAYGVDAVETGHNAGVNLPMGSNLADATTKEVLIELYAGVSGSWCYLSHSITPTMVTNRNSMSNVAVDNFKYYVGDADTSEIGSMTLREGYWGTYVPTANTASIDFRYGGT